MENSNTFDGLFTMSMVWIALVILASIVYRIYSTKGTLKIPTHEILFSERWASGASHKNFLTKLGGAANCLSVSVSRTALVVRPMFPFNLMFLPEIYDLEHAISRNKIKNITDADGKSVDIDYEMDDGSIRRIVLSLRKKDEFLRVVGQ